MVDIARKYAPWLICLCDRTTFLATKKEFIRQIPGRIIGETVDGQGRRVFVMTFRAREQDIRREKATSNMCTNHNLNVIASNIYLSLMGTEGLHQCALLNTKNAHYLEEQLLKTGNFEKIYQYPYFNEFLIGYRGDIENLNATLLEHKFIPPLAIQLLSIKNSKMRCSCRNRNSLKDELTK